MASLNKHNGGWKIRFKNSAGKQCFLFPGKMPKKNAQQVKTHIEALVSAQHSSTAIPVHTAIWLRDCDEKFLAKLHKLGLIEKPKGQSSALNIEALCDRMLEGRSEIKDSTRKVWKRCKRLLLKCFDGSKPIDSFTIGDARDFREFLIADGKAENTTRKMCSVASQFFEDAVEREEISRNPFKSKVIPKTVQPNRKRDFFITREMAEKVLQACPDHEWRLIFALSRFGGLRCPSETLSLKLSHVQWDQGRLIVPSPKTEHHEGREQRIIPIFPELRPYLEESYNQAGKDQEYLITTYRMSESNLRTHLRRIIQRAGLEPWEKTFHNLRATRQTELEEEFPTHVACSWIGNTKEVALKHYLQVTEKHFEKALERDTIRDMNTTEQGRIEENRETDLGDKDRNKHAKLHKKCRSQGTAKWSHPDSNRRPSVCKTDILTN